MLICKDSRLYCICFCTGICLCRSTTYIIKLIEIISQVISQVKSLLAKSVNGWPANALNFFLINILKNGRPGHLVMGPPQTIKKKQGILGIFISGGTDTQKLLLCMALGRGLSPASFSVSGSVSAYCNIRVSARGVVQGRTTGGDIPPLLAKKVKIYSIFCCHFS